MKVSLQSERGGKRKGHRPVRRVRRIAVVLSRKAAAEPVFADLVSDARCSPLGFPRLTGLPMMIGHVCGGDPPF